jgi:RNA polymerase sigma factor for flagellar operon FliA
MQTSASHQLITDHINFSEAVAIACFSEFDLEGVFPVGDVLAWAQRGLVEAAGRFTPDSGAKFSTYCFKRIRGAVIDGVRREGLSRRGHAYRMKAHGADASDSELGDTSPAGLFDHADLDVDTLPQAVHEPADDALHARRLREAVLKAIRSLPELERTAMLLYVYEGLNLSRIAERVGISKAYSCRVHWRALRLLATALAGVPETFGVEVGQ